MANFLVENANPNALHLLCKDAWNLCIDRFSIKDGKVVDLIIETPQGDKQKRALKFMFKASNNKAKYEDLIVDIKLYYTNGANSVRGYLHSQQDISQLNRKYKAKDETIAAYLQRVHEATSSLRHFQIIQILWSENQHDNTLSKLDSLLLDSRPKRIQRKILLERSIDSCEVMRLDSSSTQMDPILVYLAERTLSTPKKPVSYTHLTLPTKRIV